MFYHYMLFDCTYVGKVVGKATSEHGCCMPNVGIIYIYIYIYMCVCVCVCVPLLKNV